MCVGGCVGVYVYVCELAAITPDAPHTRHTTYIQALEPWRARSWKAAAVVLMAERRIGEGEEFKRMLERVVVNAQGAGE